MPLNNSGGVRQPPWSEGQNVRHLEPLGFIKFDILGLASLRMMEGAIRHILTRHYEVEDPSFEQDLNEEIDIEKEDTLTILERYVDDMEHSDKPALKNILKSLYVEALELV